MIEHYVGYIIKTDFFIKVEKLTSKGCSYPKRPHPINRPFAAGMLQASLPGRIYGMSVNGVGSFDGLLK